MRAVRQSTLLTKAMDGNERIHLVSGVNVHLDRRTGTKHFNILKDTKQPRQPSIEENANAVG